MPRWVFQRPGFACNQASAFRASASTSKPEKIACQRSTWSCDKPQPGGSPRRDARQGSHNTAVAATVGSGSETSWAESVPSSPPGLAYAGASRAPPEHLEYRESPEAGAFVFAVAFVSWGKPLP